jgi:stage II sporulation protein D
MMRRLILLLCLALLCLAGVPLGAQSNAVRVRLYAVHPPERVTLAGELKWKTCEECPAARAAQLTVTAARGQLRIAGDSLPRPQLFITGSYRLTTEGQPPLSTSYPLELRAEQDRIVMVATLGMEDYVSAVLAGESGNFRNQESMKAMAVAVRSYATRFRGRHAAEGFGFCDTTHCQDMRLAAADLRTRQAAEATAGELLWYRGALATAYYHQHCGGTLAAAGEVWPTVHAPYLKSHVDPYCAATPLHWHATIGRAELEQALASAEVKLPAGWRTVAVAARTPSGRALRLRFSGRGGEAEVSASTVRFAVGRALGWNQIRSELYEVRMDDAGATFTGAGAGHGVGLCQAGAEQMAAKGSSYRDILAFYYPGTNVAQSSAIAWQLRKSEHFDALVTDTSDAAVLDVAERVLGELEAATGWKLAQRPKLQVFATLDAYRDTTGQPGWVAATTRGTTIRLQPLGTLRAHSALESTLRHELLHLVLEPHTDRRAPLWLREGLALYYDGAPHAAGRTMSDEAMESALEHPRDAAEQQAAYAAARARVAALIREHGKEAVLGWLAGGAPLGR